LTVRRRLTVSGVVQGVGFRPFVWRRARDFGLSGWVENRSEGVAIEVQGPAAAVRGFLEAFAAAAPPRAVIDRVAVDHVSVSVGPASFAIRQSVAQEGVATSVPADIAPCAACLAELFTPGDRRHRYPFINCTDCGPRFTIIDRLPYDRGSTTMRGFTMCGRCADEYADPCDRRFHAQPNACPDCGPLVWFTTSGDRDGIATDRKRAQVVGDAAVAAAVAMLRAGGIVGLKGLGGFHLACDATSAATVARLRVRKRRVGKPLAVMVRDVETAIGLAVVDTQERRLLEAPERPIVIMRKRRGTTIAEAVSPGNDFFGVMLPFTPLHHLLCTELPPLVMTSGNLTEEPIVRDNSQAAALLGPLVDGFLMHDREIRTACDDSVVRCGAGTATPIRRSRGHAPLPIRLARAGPGVLAVGGELKAAVCVARDDRAWVSQHIGDMGNVETLDALGAAVDRLLQLFNVEPEAVVGDLHPGYASTAWARGHAAKRGIPFVPVQHHEAHVAALLAEHGGREAAIGVCFDGTGYGRDGTIWGGEFFAVRGGVYRRAAHVEPLPLPGGDTCIRQPRRTALALLHAAECGWDERLPPVAAVAAHDRRVLERQLAAGLNSVATSSMGRLFDAVAALAGLRQSVTYEAEAALALESLAAEASAAEAETPGHGYAFAILDADPLRVCWRDVVRAVARDAIDRILPQRIATAFHQAVAAMIVAVCRRLRDAGAGDVVGLTGGVFQNAVLVSLACTALGRAGFEVLVHEQVPANDGGLALGQAVLARHALAAGAHRGPIR
jgi:hydrogenase maturation protein HypF